MSDATKILSYFEEQLVSIISSKEEKVKKMREDDEALFERFGRKTPEQIRLHKQFMQQPKTIQTGINLEIDSYEVALEVHSKIQELLKEKAYPVEEVDWFRFNGTTRWNFKFNY